MKIKLLEEQCETLLAGNQAQTESARTVTQLRARLAEKEREEAHPFGSPDNGGKMAQMRGTIAEMEEKIIDLQSKLRKSQAERVILEEAQVSLVHFFHFELYVVNRV